MASFRARGNGWEATVDLMVNGTRIRKSQIFDKKGQAQAWAADFESTTRAERRGEVVDRPLVDLFDRYVAEVCPTKKGERFETLRLAAFSRDPALKNLSALSATSTDMAKWRDRRLKEVSPATVNREWNLISNVFTVARKEWRWARDNPMADVKRPPSTPARTKLPTQDEIDAMCLALGYDEDIVPETDTARVGAAFLFAIETAMRAGEIRALMPEDVDLVNRVAVVRGTDPGAGKSGRRVVPLTTRAVWLIQSLPETDGPLFGLKSASMDVLFRKGRARAGVGDLHFHDSRALALTRLSTKLKPLQLAKVAGHKNLQMILNVYYRETMEDVAKLLD
jgi:integrase